MFGGEGNGKYGSAKKNARKKNWKKNRQKGYSLSLYILLLTLDYYYRNYAS